MSVQARPSHQRRCPGRSGAGCHAAGEGAAASFDLLNRPTTHAPLDHRQLRLASAELAAGSNARPEVPDDASASTPHLLIPSRPPAAASLARGRHLPSFLAWRNTYSWMATATASESSKRTTCCRRSRRRLELFAQGGRTRIAGVCCERRPAASPTWAGPVRIPSAAKCVALHRTPLAPARRSRRGRSVSAS